jgi:omega-6 fatty acid desaturase (delta-12 desaturase)
MAPFKLLWAAVVSFPFLHPMAFHRYLITHATGKKYGKRTNHFEPTSPLFRKADYWSIVLSDVVLFAWVGVLIYAANTMGIGWLTKTYIVPYLIVNMWLVLITDLQHTDPSIPHYRGAEWTWIKGMFITVGILSLTIQFPEAWSIAHSRRSAGALCTMDRDYGHLNAVFHHIGDTHVAHHLFSKMPHYHAQEATEAIKPLLGK